MCRMVGQSLVPRLRRAHGRIPLYCATSCSIAGRTIQPDTVTVTVALIFCVVYLGMILGALPFLSLDRTGIALLGAIALLTIGDLTLDQAAQAIHLPTIILLFSFMVVSAQLRLGGFYAWVTIAIGALGLSPPMLL